METLYKLTNEEKASILKLTRKIPEYTTAKYSNFEEAINKEKDLIPVNIKKWRNQSIKYKFGLLKNLPIDVLLPPTPTTRFGEDSRSMLSDKIIGLISGLFGKMYTYEGKTTDRHIQNVHPIIGDEETQLGSSKVKLEWHVEDGFHDNRPDWVGLLCLKSDPDVITSLARAKDFDLTKRTFEDIKSKSFSLRIDDSFCKVSHSLYVKTNLLFGEFNNPDIVYDPAYTKEKDQGTLDTFEMIENLAHKVKFDFILEKGDLLIFNNRKVIHGRSSYNPKMDGNDRWLKRSLVLTQENGGNKIENGYLNHGLRI